MQQKVTHNNGHTQFFIITISAFWRSACIPKAFLYHKEPLPNGLYIAPLSFSISSYTDRDRKACDVGERANCRFLRNTLAVLAGLSPHAALIVRTELVRARVTKMQVSRAARFLVGAERSRCREGMFNRISPSLLDIFHDSRAVSHFLNVITPHIISGLLLCGGEQTGQL